MASDTGIPSLRVALRRAKRAGATVTNVYRTGEVRVESALLGRRINVNNRRHDATRELMHLVTELEAIPKMSKPHAPLNGGEVALVPPAQPAPAQPLKHGDIGARVNRYLRTLSPGPDGWVAYPGVGIIAQALGLTRSQVSTALNGLERNGAHEIEWRRNPNRTYSAFRYRSDAPAPEAELRAVVLPDEPRRVIAPALGLVPETPALTKYAEARVIASHHPMLKLEPTDLELDAILSDAVRLYHWLRAGRK